LNVTGSIVQTSLTTSSFAGSVGIGTTITTGSLDVLGNVYIKTSAGNQSLFFPRSSDPNHGLSIGEQTSVGSKSAVIRTAGGVSHYLFIDAGLDDSNAIGNIALASNNTGSVGIGTNAPLSKFHQVISDGATYAGDARFGGSSTQFGIELKYNQASSTSGSIYLSPGYSSTNVLFKLGAGSGNINQLVLQGNGNVGIGTTAPAYKLDVVGGIRCQSPIRISNESTYGITFTSAGGSTGNTIFADGGQGLVLGGNGATALTFSYNSTTATFAGAVSKASGTFKIDHPLESLSATHQLVHSFIEGPRVDLIYRGIVNLLSGRATINIDTASGMSEGTFVALNRETQFFITNQSGWNNIKGSLQGNILNIEAEDTNSTDTIAWMVIGERQDKHIKDTDWTDSNGKPILEPVKN
jgi:hypothetical protein